MWQEDSVGVAKFINACLHKMDLSFEGQISYQPGVAERDLTHFSDSVRQNHLGCVGWITA